MINFLIIHYNTPQLTECLVKSINKFVGTDCSVYIFDNSDKHPFKYRQNNLTIFDNTHGKIIDFNDFLKKYPNTLNNSSKENNFASAKHCYSVDKCFDLINDNFILLDSDVLLKKNISELYDENYIYIGEIGQQALKNGKKSKPRVIPYLCFINVKECKKNGIRYFDGEHMLGLRKNNSENNLYETGSWFLESVNKYKHKDINVNEYINHYGSASFNEKNNEEKIEKWLKINQTLWFNEKNKRVIYTCVTGGYEKIVDPTYIQTDFDYICFTDNMEQKTNVWQLKPIPQELSSLSKVKQQRIIKICPHKYLSEYDESLWVDGAIDILDNMNSFLQTYCNDRNKSVFIRRHSQRKCIYQEAKVCISMRKDTSANIDPQMKRYQTEGFPSNYGLVESNIIYRKHNEPYCIKLMETWANELKKGSHRDQLSFNYTLWKNGESGFKYLDTNVIKSKYFKWYSSHNRKPKTILGGQNEFDIVKKKLISEQLFYGQYIF